VVVKGRKNNHQQVNRYPEELNDVMLDPDPILQYPFEIMLHSRDGDIPNKYTGKRGYPSNSLM